MAIVTQDGDNVIIVTNANNPVTVSMFKKFFCKSDIWVVIDGYNTVAVNNVLIIPIPKEVGLYKVTVTNQDGEIVEYIIDSYKSFVKSFVEGIKYVLCECPCQDCEDCGDLKREYLNTLIKLLAYNTVNEADYNDDLTATNSCVKCSIIDINQCLITNEGITGSGNNDELIKNVIAYYYLVYYFRDMVKNNSSINITELYQYNTIVKCIAKLEIDINCIKDKIYQNPEGIYTFEFIPTFV